MGRSDGGAIGDSEIQLYRPSWRVRGHLLFQVDFFSEMQQGGFYEHLKKPFVFAWISETQYYFVQTAAEDINAVYHFDSNAPAVQRTEWDLAGFIGRLFAVRDMDMSVVAEGDILLI
ncbi:SMI1/KNR4 family protein [Pseudomonas vanderleydeniana]|uniref:SMI1/KNR4 family protein n=2 Tax=Pseudomonas vanderleydeniana TaxID=2745495 RepID=A0A9E6TVE9_9PSED|nr:SMI1/KNR4 family protein [Pseudomonas vanderleydeniana]